MKNTLQSLYDLGQSVWCDNLSRRMIDSGELQRLIDQGIVGIDQDGNRADLAAGDGSKDASLFQLDMARALGEEDEPDEIGAGFARGFDDGRRPHATDFDLDRHVLALG